MKRRFNFRAQNKPDIEFDLQQDSEIFEPLEQTIDFDIKHIYRFRPIDKLIGENFQELIKQEIYFSPVQDLNDPLENIIDIFWQGDYIVWQNLFNHYLLCTTYMTIMTSLYPYENLQNFSQDIPMELNPKELFPPEYITLFTHIQKSFFDNPDIKNTLTYLAEKQTPIKKSELLTIISIVNRSITLNIIFSLLQEKGLFKNPLLTEYLTHFNDNIKKSLALLYKKDIRKEMDIPIGKVDTELSLLFNNLDAQLILNDAKYSDIYPNALNLEFLLFDLPLKYLERLPELIHKSFYVACFLPNSNDFNAWSYYADKHQGVCLKFKTHLENNHPTLQLKSNRYQKRLLHKVNYDTQTIKTNFFLSLMSLTGSELENHWYKDDKGKTSNCFKEIVKNIKENKLTQRDSFKRLAITKPAHFSSENEYRIVLNEKSFDLSDKQTRKLHYKFSDLEALIFGLNTAASDKRKIIQIIQQKCLEQNRQSFDFYQAKYDEVEQEISLEKLTI